MSNLLIEEVNPLLTESKKDNSGKWIIEGVFAQAAVKNRNGRVYPPEVLKEAVGKYKTDYVSQHRALGELLHPNRATVDPSLAVIKIDSLDEDGHNWNGRATLLNTQQGKNLQALLEAGVKVGVSTRALGTLKESNGVNIVQSDLSLRSVDVVLDPSAPDAWVNAIMEETETIYCPNENCYMLAEEIKQQIKKSSSKNLEATVLNAWNRYCKQLNLR